MYLVDYLLLQTIFVVSKSNITNIAIIIAANINIYIYFVRKLTISIVVLIKYNI